MNKLINPIFLISLTLTSLNVQAAGNQGQDMGAHTHESPCQLTSEQVLLRTVSEQEVENLNFMREEEKLARDVYTALFELWNTNIFTNIAASEQQHMDKVKVFLDAYRLPDPASNETGKFNNSALQDLYDELFAKGSQSKLEALKVGAMVEEVDIFDLENAIKETENNELKVMYRQLMLASHNHLRAFSRQIINLEGEYVAQYMSSEAVATILDQPKPVMIHGNAMLLDTEGNVSENDACFVGSINSAQGFLQNGSSIKSEDSITVSHQITANSSNLNQIADWIIVVSFKANNSNQTQFFTHNGDNWQSWDGQINQLSSTNSKQLLVEEYTLPIFQGKLQGLSGEFSIFSGYRLENGSIIYNRFPTVFNVN